MKNLGSDGFIEVNPFSNCCGAKDKDDRYGNIKRRLRLNCCNSWMEDITIKKCDIAWPSDYLYWMGKELPGETPTHAMYTRGSREALEDDLEGCPGGYIHSPYIQSLLPYFRDKAKDGQRIENLRLKMAQDNRLIVEAVAEYEYWDNWQANAKESYIHDVHMAKMKHDAMSAKANSRR